MARFSFAHALKLVALASAAMLFAATATAKVEWLRPTANTATVAATFQAVTNDPNVLGHSTEDTAWAVVGSGELEGDWFFRGGNFREAPTSYALLSQEFGSDLVRVTFVCEDTEATCSALRRRAADEAERRSALGPPPPPPPPPPGYVAQPLPPRLGPLTFHPTASQTDAACKYCPQPEYPRDQLDARLGGTVNLMVSYNVAGEVTEITIARSSGIEALDGAALEAARKWRIEPGTVDKQPKAGAAMVPVVFTPNPPQ